MRNPLNITGQIIAILIALPLLILLPGCAANGKLVNPFQESVVVTPQPDGTTKTNVVTVVAPEWSQTLDAIEATGQLVPPPWGTWVSLGSAGIAALLAAWARNKQKSAEDVANTIIGGIEAMGTNAQAVKDAVNAASKIKGNQATVHAAVKRLTK